MFKLNELGEANITPFEYSDFKTETGYYHDQKLGVINTKVHVKLIVSNFIDNDNNLVKVGFITEIPNEYELMFEVVNSKGRLSGTDSKDKTTSDLKNYLRIINTVATISKKFIEKYKPNELKISSGYKDHFSKFSNQKSKVYDLYLRKNKPIGYDLYKEDNEFYLTKTNLKEDNVTGGAVSFSPGYGENYATPKAFGKKKKQLTHVLGYKPAPKKKYHTKTFDVVKWHENRIREIKITGKNFIRRYESYEEYIQDNPNLVSWAKHPGMFDSYNQKGGVWRIRYKGKNYLSGNNGDASDDTNSNIRDRDLHEEIRKFFLSEYAKLNISEIKIIPTLKVLELRTDNLWKDKEKYKYSLSPSKIGKLLKINEEDALRFIIDYIVIYNGIELVPENDNKLADITIKAYEKYKNSRNLEESIEYTDESSNSFYNEYQKSIDKYKKQLSRLKNKFLSITIDDLLVNLEDVKKQIQVIEKITQSIDKIREKLDDIKFNYSDKSDWTNSDKFSKLEKIYGNIYEGYYAIQWFLEEIVSTTEEFIEDKDRLLKALNNIDDKDNLK